MPPALLPSSPRPRFLLLPLLFLSAVPLPAQEIPLDHCDSLPVVPVKAAGRNLRFLLDTAATTILNLNSFGAGADKDLSVTSWSGTRSAGSTDVTLSELDIGSTKFLRTTLPAIDLSAIGKACGGTIDGILGVDFLKRLGASIDLKRHTLHVLTLNEQHDAERVAALQRDLRACAQAFNDSNEKAFADCLDPRVSLFTADAAFLGRPRVLGYLRQKFFHQRPAIRLDIREKSLHSIGPAVWGEYEFTAAWRNKILHGRGMARWQENAGQWRLASLLPPVLDEDPPTSPAPLP